MTPPPEIIGSSSAMCQLRHEIAIAARSEATALVSGDSGTGKELVACWIHAGSRRAAAPFVAVNMAALNEDIAESELFGHRRGSFTGAATDRKGLIRQAEGGTLFLDEIGDLSPTIQAKLLRVLQERQIWPVGSDQPQHVDVRLVAATHKPLQHLVRLGQFRLDLYHRLNQYPIYVPPLRQRPEDIWPLFEHFLAHYLEREQRGPARADASVRDAVMSRPWEGNVRELQNAAYVAALRCHNGVITADLLPGGSDLPRPLAGVSCDRDTDGGGVPAQPAAAAPLQRIATGEALAWLRPRQRLSVQRLAWALRAAHGNRSEAAKLLEVSRSTLYRRLREVAADGPSPCGRHTLTVGQT